MQPPTSAPVWPELAQALLAGLAEPTPTDRILAWGSKRHGWTQDRTRNVLAWAEAAGLARHTVRGWVAVRPGRPPPPELTEQPDPGSACAP